MNNVFNLSINNSKSTIKTLIHKTLYTTIISNWLLIPDSHNYSPQAKHVNIKILKISLHRRWDHYSNGRNGLDWLGWWRRTCPNRFGWLLLLLLLLLPHDQCRGRCFVVTIEFEVSRRSDFIFVVCFFLSFKYIYDVIVLVFDYWLLTWISLILYFFNKKITFYEKFWICRTFEKNQGKKLFK